MKTTSLFYLIAPQKPDIRPFSESSLEAADAEDRAM